jgi:hypothetical protein
VEIKSEAQQQAENDWQQAKAQLMVSLKAMQVGQAQQQLQSAPLAADGRLDNVRQTLSAYSHQQALIARAKERIHTPQPTTIKEVR